MTDIHESKSQWQTLIQRSFLSLYQLSASEVEAQAKSEGYRGYDFSFEFEEGIVHMLVHEQVLHAPSLSVEKARIDAARNEMVKQLNERHNQLSAAHKLIEPQSSVKTQGKPVYFLALTALSVVHDAKTYVIEHHYNTKYLVELGVVDQRGVDLKDGQNLLQIFSLGDMAMLLETLATPSDWLAYLQYQRHKLANGVAYDNEKSLLEQFLLSSQYFQRALAVQQQLMDIGLLDAIEPRLLNYQVDPNYQVDTGSSDGAAKDKTTALSQQLIKHSKMWYTLINGMCKRRFKQDDTVPVEQVKKLIDESMYTRCSIMEEVMDYANASPEERQQGYIRHQHSYNAFGRHYMLIFYAQDSSSPLSTEAVCATSHELLAELNHQLQTPVMRDLFILGFDFSQHNEQGQTEVRLDTFYQVGAEVNDAVAHHEQQVTELKSDSL